jgi:hypothetical protein
VSGGDHTVYMWDKWGLKVNKYNTNYKKGNCFKTYHTFPTLLRLLNIDRYAGLVLYFMIHYLNLMFNLSFVYIVQSYNGINHTQKQPRGHGVKGE